MTPKEQYEARRTERKERQEAATKLGRTHDEKEALMEDLLDRFVTAVERIAAAIQYPMDER